MMCRHFGVPKRDRLVQMILLAACFVLSGQNGHSDHYPGTLAVAAEGSETHEDANHSLCCQRLATLIEEQKAHISRESGQLRRELAALRNDLARPGMREVAAGIGYIVGLAGVGLYLLARKTRGTRG